MVRVLAQMDLFAVVTFEPSSAVGEFRRWRNPAIAQDIDQERLLGLRLTHRNAKVHMMESEHLATLPPGERHVIGQTKVMGISAPWTVMSLGLDRPHG